jgi:hypothetical protein
MDEDSPAALSSGGKPNTPASAPPANVAQNAAGVSKRKRGLGVVTPNACTECRKKRAKVRSSDKLGFNVVTR